LIRPLLKSGGARLATLPTSAAFAFLTSHLVISRFGTDAYAQYGLLIGIIALFPFTDLGIGAALTNALAQSTGPETDSHVRRVLLSSLRILLISSAAFTMAGIGIAVLGLWQALLGSAASSNEVTLAATACWLIFAISIPMSIGQRMLLGLHKNHVQVLIQGLQPPLTAAAVFAVSMLSVNPFWPPVIFYCSMAITTGVSLAVATDIVPGALRWAARNVFRLRSVHGERVWGTAAPMLIIMVALPLAVQSARIVLSHVGTTQQLAEYNLGSQLFSPVMSIVGVVSASLWPIYARQRLAANQAEAPPRVISTAFLITAVALSVSVAVAVVSPWLAQLIANGKIVLPILLPISFCIFVAVQALQSSLGIFLTDPRGLRAQAICAVLLLPSNVGLSIWFADSIGAAGPLLASAVCIGVIQAVPCLIMILWRRRVTATIAVAA
jgi:O-antigen/teichoic acid export membrane protein